ncbi:PfkB family carbohydrate kinase [Cellulomonas massiliensis]|uniref:PfkB family carbohydrate kinase n=1 Tax=Cellulomonas massiliensis TaxID=1465811 RepID=UPI00030C4298|nr:PfkB family carbohydrate kinase [Cellulomonas massiliensis]
MSARLVCAGLATLDVVQVVDALPGPDEKVVARSASVAFGGPAANAAATAVALGVPTVLVTALGTGPVADAVRSGLAGRGVEVVDLLEGLPGSPAVSTVLVTRATGERSVVSVNATGVARLDDAAAAVAEDVLRGADALLLDGHHLAAAVALARAARSGGVPVLLDGGSWKPGLEELLALVDHAVLSADFRAPDPGHVLDAVAAWGAATVARSSGAGPVEWRSADGDRGLVRPPAVAAGDVVDTLGAGDVLHGAFAAEVARGADVPTALGRAVQVATRSVRHAGALGWVDAVAADGR